jgi:hypothetical protein
VDILDASGCYFFQMFKPPLTQSGTGDRFTFFTCVGSFDHSSVPKSMARVKFQTSEWQMIIYIFINVHIRVLKIWPVIY